MLKDVRDISLFSAIAGADSLSAAARQLGLSLAVVSKRLNQMEQQLGVRLFHRTTRHISLTDEGQIFAIHAARLLDEFDAVENALSSRKGNVSGTLRITATHSLGRRWLMPIVSDFMQQHESLKLQFNFSDEVIDLAESGFDLAIRFGALNDSRLVARELAPNRRVLCASPAYAERCGLPQSFHELAVHTCIGIGESAVVEWFFGAGEEQQSIMVNPRYRVNNGEAAHELALRGAGITLKSLWDVADDLRSHKLIEVLPHQPLSAAPLHAIWLNGRHQPLRVRLFVAQLKTALQSAWHNRVLSQ
ncbi:LysR family transcriptional regulator [[Pantoea] beijingensis]|uniref:LysR family transcriptional regulator n=1 Tax=[Pantoea] beijingensis TaxID=1324864 RepID=A0A443IAI1_9GAMM|nr:MULTISPECIES: LysR family transcriptional regulator [Erwiniaceae]RWR01231.1 LysR family transcriptional regulator [[Pantoea] beijingensis]